MTERREESAMKQRQERADSLVVDLNEDSRMELLFSSIWIFVK